MPDTRSTVSIRLILLVMIVISIAVTAVSTPGAQAKGDSDAVHNTVRDAAYLERVDERTLRSSRHLVHDIDPAPNNTRINAVIEIPAGTTQKWEVEKASGNLVWELRKEKLRRVKYLGYPGNYGMIPRTVLSAEEGGDGDPLDILVLGPAVPRGAIIEVQIIGLLKMLDKGEQDDKLIAVPATGAFRKVDSIDELDEKFPGVSDIVSTWFANYKGAKKIQVQGYSGPEGAQAVLSRALQEYTARR